MRTVSDQQRRARIALRHGIAPGHRHGSLRQASSAMTCLHATDNATVYLSAHARVDGLMAEHVSAGLYDQRVLVKQMAMRRTIFAVGRDLLPAALGGPAARVADQERRRTIRELERSGETDAAGFLAAAEEAVVETLQSQELTSTQLREALPGFSGTIHVAPGTKWGAEAPLMPRLLTILSAAGQVVRGHNNAQWRLSRPGWTAMRHWLGEEPAPLDPRSAYAELVRRWLWSFGPGTEGDLVWWLGSTKSAVRRALTDLEAVEVALEGGGTGWLLADDVSPVPEPEPWAALLPVLDPTTMGWKERSFYLGEHGAQVFDSVGNGGNSAWWCGRIVGGWVQDPAGRIVLQPLETISAQARSALAREAARLEEWLGGVRLHTYFPSPLMRRGGRS